MCIRVTVGCLWLGLGLGLAPGTCSVPAVVVLDCRRKCWIVIGSVLCIRTSGGSADCHMKCVVSRGGLGFSSPQ